MSNSNISAPEIVDFGPKWLTGLQITTSYATAAQDCPALWEKFATAIKLEKLTQGASYGVSIMGSEPTRFDYFAGVDYPPAGTDPAQFSTLALPGGKYARCRVRGMENIGGAFNLLYENDAVAKVSEYTVNMFAPCFEMYTAEYTTEQVFYIYAPIQRK